MEAELTRIGHDLQPLDIVVVNTSAGVSYGQPDYVASGCGMGREATLYLEMLPANGFYISCMPVKIKAASAGWTRAAAILFE